MASRELSEHAGYLSDQFRLSAYRDALTSMLANRDASVLDLGAGTGILGLMAAEAGARVVYSVDSGSIIGPAAEVAARAPGGTRIVHIHGLSTELELPEPIDVAVCDQIGGFVHDGGVLRHFADVRRRLLAPDGLLVPARFRLFLAPAECKVIREQIDLWGSTPEGFDFEPFAQAAINAEHYVYPDEVRCLGAGVEVAAVASDHVEPIVGDGRATISENGDLDGLLGWFEADLGDGVTLTNDPTDPARMKRWCNFYPLQSRHRVSEGDAVAVAVDVRPVLNAVTWQVALELGEERTPEERHSTLLGAFIAPDEIARAHGEPVRTTQLGDVVREMLTLANGSRSEGEILEQLLQRDELREVSPSVGKTLRETLRRFSVPNGPRADRPRP